MIYALTNQHNVRQGLQRSSDGGLTWVERLTPSGYGGLSCVRASGARVLVAETNWDAAHALVNLSSDHGDTWEQIELVLSHQAATPSCELFAGAPLRQLVSTGEPSVLFTADGWQSVQQAAMPAEIDEAVTAMWASPHDGLAFASTNNESCRSTDFGESWTLLGDDPFNRIIDLAFHPDPGRAGVVVVAAETQDGIYVSRDGGLTWSLLEGSDAQAPLSVAIDPDDPSRLYVGTEAGTFVGRGAQL
jgi:hypothetical protein